ncbi:BQ5605_C004g02722 [Microbotryum silenes-dioicae]|uniref:BQ5605_C004g02722 protein n=1 Tax=Microbotryum silenes-dioicae TaxID=796604 RepID=A0A2X0MVQ4_9BASI|nr:BQ5605_C004g02722 [Microbotryum silenes-dioicae]
MDYLARRRQQPRKIADPAATTPSREAAARNQSTRRRANWIVKSICAGSRQSQCRTAITDLSRVAGSSTDATATSATIVVDRRSAAQRQRRQRERERSSQIVPTALLPLPERPVPRHDLESMTLQCPICSALHWEFEKSPTPGGATPFKICCADGKFRVPAELLALLTGDGPDYKGHGIISGSGPPSFYLSGMAFHRIGTLAPAPANDPVFAQILFLAPTERIEARRRFNGPPEEVRRLDSAYQQIVPLLDGMLRHHNRRVKLFLTAQEYHGQ